MLAAAVGFVSACTDDTSLGSADAGPDVAVIDGAVGERQDAAGGNLADAAGDAATDGGTDAAVLPALCEKTYPNTSVSGDAGASEPEEMPRYDFIALRAIFTGAVNASGSCEIGKAFVEDPDPFVPVPYMCLGKQLAALAGCKVQGTPDDYAVAQDDNGDHCAPSDGGTSVELGFWNPESRSYTANDVDYMVSVIRAAAIETGMAAADADRLAAILETQKTKVVRSDAGFGDAGFSQSTCE
jgi:hypothetical protein